MKIDQIEVGKVYHNKKGRRRLVNRFGRKYGWDGVFYTPINEKGKEGAEQFCTLSTFAAWSVGEWDPSMPVAVTATAIPYGAFAIGDIVDHRSRKILRRGEILSLSKSGRTARVKWPRSRNYMGFTSGFKIENLKMASTDEAHEGN